MPSLSKLSLPHHSEVSQTRKLRSTVQRKEKRLTTFQETKILYSHVNSGELTGHMLILTTYVIVCKLKTSSLCVMLCSGLIIYSTDTIHLVIKYSFKINLSLCLNKLFLRIYEHFRETNVYFLHYLKVVDLCSLVWFTFIHNAFTHRVCLIQ